MRQVHSTAPAPSSPFLSICPPLPGVLKKYERPPRAGVGENPFIIPGVCGVGEINRGVPAVHLYSLCEPNTLTWGKEDEWVVGGEEVRGLQR